MPNLTVRQRDAERKRRASRDAKDVAIPPCRDKRRRRRLEKDDVKWLRLYFGPDSGERDPFTYAFTSQQLDMIASFGRAIRSGGDQSIAAPRGEGKTTILERLIVKYTLQGELNYSVLFQSTGTLADNSLDTIKTSLEENDRLADDYPEVCVPIRALENTPNRAHYQTVSGKRHDNGKPFQLISSRFSWCGQEIILPDVPGSPAAAAIIATRGLDSAVRGLKKRGKRPQLAAIDDPDTEDSSRSEEQAKKLTDRIDKAIGGLGGQRNPIARILLSTIQSRVSVSYLFTDAEKKPSWRPRRYRFLVEPPERVDLWEEYIKLRQIDWLDNTDTAHKFYLANRETMDAGAVIANPNRHTAEESSALEHYYTLVARLGQEAVSTEYDNDPPEEMGPVESGITASKIQRRLSGYPRRIIPPQCIALTQGVDVKKSGLHWVLKAWLSDATNYIVDYGFHETSGTTYGSDDGIELAIVRAILERLDAMHSDPCTTADGEIVPADMTLIDSGWQSQAVYQACMQAGLGVFPAKGHGKSHGCSTPNFADILRHTRDRKPGDGWFQSKQPGGVWLVNCDTDRWKTFEHARWLTQEGKPGASYLFGDMSSEERRYLEKRLPREAVEHFSFAQHLTAEVEVEDVVRGVMKRFWKVKAGRVNNHYLDASYLADVAAAMKGVRLLGETRPQRSAPANRPSAKDLAAGKR